MGELVFWRRADHPRVSRFAKVMQPEVSAKTSLPLDSTRAVSF